MPKMLRCGDVMPGYAHPRERGFTHGAIDCRRPLVAKPDHRFVSANGYIPPARRQRPSPRWRLAEWNAVTRGRALYLRRVSVEPTDEYLVMHAFTLTASDMIRIAGATAILVFQQIGHRRGFIWLGDGDGDGGGTLDFDRAGSAAEFVERFGAAHEVLLSYDARQLPGRAPKLWSADIVADDVRGRGAASVSEHHILNMAALQHRGTGLATVFLGLAPRATPQSTPQAAWDRLLLVHEARRLCGAPVGAAVRMIPPWLCGGSTTPHA